MTSQNILQLLFFFVVLVHVSPTSAILNLEGCIVKRIPASDTHFIYNCCNDLEEAMNGTVSEVHGTAEMTKLTLSTTRDILTNIHHQICGYKVLADLSNSTIG